MSAWKSMAEAPQRGSILLDLGFSIPGTKDIRVGSWISQATAIDIGEEIAGGGGWLIWNSDSDWFIVDLFAPRRWTEIPE